eukprot:CAMPEP_0198286992 /NCGR_PEP_ID=MMETSP1449-20131203/5941_1 /TAXON_ID=420275 /ORGANISM="Attheya septentrionalis, Strain CCMP2084" /LENGTH=599 /DNA_ID=CAMNT_0043984869 /DNA_START=172 /DNA_END=1968 /DNA_ORIENTATION=-
MDFEQLYEGPAVLAKHLELRFYHSCVSTGNNSANNNDLKQEHQQLFGIQHRMPFLPRNLAYVREDVSPPKRKGHTQHSKPRVHRKESGPRGSRRVDLLWKLFRYRPKKYNGLASVRRGRSDSSKVTPVFVEELPRYPQPKVSKGPYRKYNSPRGSSSRERREKQRSIATPASPATPGSKVENMEIVVDGSSDVDNRVYYHSCFDPRVTAAPSRRVFPAYHPFEQGVWIPPTYPKTAVQLFFNSNRALARKSLAATGADKNDKAQVKDQLWRMWKELDEPSIDYWKQEEAWDGQRYLYEKSVYRRAAKNPNDESDYDSELDDDDSEDEEQPQESESFLSLTKEMESSSESQEEMHDIERSKGAAAAAASALSIDIDSSRFSLEAQSTPLAPSTKKAFFYYIFMSKDALPFIHVEMREDFRCPLCFHDSHTHEGLLLHCQTSHSGRLRFDGALDEEANLNIAVRVDSKQSMTKPTVPEQLMDFVYVRPQNVEAVPSSSSLSFVKRPYHRLAVLDVAQRKKKIRLLEMNGADTEVINRFIPEDKYPIRQYYHSRTTLPMRESEWDVDSDDEPDETWLHRMSAELLDDFEDVSSKEKIFMKSW